MDFDRSFMDLPSMNSSPGMEPAGPSHADLGETEALLGLLLAPPAPQAVSPERPLLRRKKQRPATANTTSSRKSRAGVQRWPNESRQVAGDRHGGGDESGTCGGSAWYRQGLPGGGWAAGTGKGSLQERRKHMSIDQVSNVMRLANKPWLRHEEADARKAPTKKITRKEKEAKERKVFAPMGPRIVQLEDGSVRLKCWSRGGVKLFRANTGNECIGRLMGVPGGRPADALLRSLDVQESVKEWIPNSLGGVAAFRLMYSFKADAMSYVRRAWVTPF